jgi:hypothetical protein
MWQHPLFFIAAYILFQMYERKDEKTKNHVDENPDMVDTLIG